MAIDKELLEILACPKCRQPVKLNDDQTALICHESRLLYRIEDDIPLMLIAEATPLES